MTQPRKSTKAARQDGGGIPEPTLERLYLYRRCLLGLREGGATHVFSHELGRLARATAHQVRRDLMAVGYRGTAQKGYEVTATIGALSRVLDVPSGRAVALVGIGHLGRAMLAYFIGRRPHLSIVAAFDDDPAKAHRVIHGCRCHPVEELAEVVVAGGIRTAILAVPAGPAQTVTDQLVAAGVRGIVNCAPVRLWVPEGVHVEDLDMTIALEKVAYLAQPTSTEGE